MTKNYTRRDVLKGSLFGMAGAAALGLSGCAPSAPAQASAENGTAMSETGGYHGVETEMTLNDAAYDVDVVIVGSGAAGMAATVEAAENGLNTLLIEASSGFGGTTQFAEGILGVNTPLQQQLGVTNSIEEMVKGELVFSNYTVDPRLIRGFLEEADEDIQWLRDHGVQFYDVIGGLTQHLYVDQGKQMIAALEETARKAGATMLLSTRGKRLFMENGCVTGILAEGDDGEFAIGAKAVVLACGGYIQNEDMMSSMLRFDTKRIKVTAAPNHEGDDITMVYAAGGDQSGITTLHFIWAGLESFDLHSQLSTAACNEPFFMVNESGVRFCDESLLCIGGANKGPSLFCNPIMNQKRAFSILSQGEVDRIASEGCTVGWGSYIFAGTPLDDLQNQLDEAAANPPAGFWTAATLDELAEKLEVDGATLAAEVKKYNGFVAEGADGDYFKDAHYLREVGDGPYYAFELMCNAFATMGGIRVNERGEVLDGDHNAIPGLYNAGISCSGLQGTTYCPLLGGGAQGYAVFSGRNCIRSIQEA